MFTHAHADTHKYGQTQIHAQTQNKTHRYWPFSNLVQYLAEQNLF